MANEKFRDSTLSPAERAADLLSRLTLREKVGQVNQRLYGFNSYTRTGDRVELSEDFQKGGRALGWARRAVRPVPRGPLGRQGLRDRPYGRHGGSGV